MIGHDRGLLVIGQVDPHDRVLRWQQLPKPRQPGVRLRSPRDKPLRSLMDVLLDALGYQARQPHQEDVSTSSTHAHKELLGVGVSGIGPDARVVQRPVSRILIASAPNRPGSSLRPGSPGADGTGCRGLQRQCSAPRPRGRVRPSREARRRAERSSQRCRTERPARRITGTCK